MVDLLALSRGRGEACASNQVLYNLTRRGIEFDLMPLCREHGMPIMAYSPIEQGRMLRNPELGKVAKAVGATPAQVALAWLLQQDGVIAIPKATNLAHLRENIAALDVKLDESCAGRARPRLRAAEKARAAGDALGEEFPQRLR